MASIGKVSAVFTANSSGLRKGTDDAVRALGRMQGTLNSVRTGITALTAIAGAQLFANMTASIIRGGRAFAGWIDSSRAVIDNLSKLAQRTGLLYSELAGLNLAADLAGVSTEKLAAATQRADRTFVLATEGNAAAIQSFERLGLTVQELQGLTDAERFAAIADAIAEIPDPATRTTAAIQLFGRSGAELIPLFNAGSGAIREATEQAERFGLALTSQQARDVEAMTDAFALARAAIQGVVDQVTAYLAPAIVNIVNLFTEFVGSVGGANLGQAIGDGILDGAIAFAQFADRFIAQFQSVWAVGAAVGDAWNSTLDVASRIFSFFSGVANSFQAGLGLVILGFGKVAELFIAAASSVSDALGLGAFEETLAAIGAFNGQIASDFEANVNQAASDFGAVFGSAAKEAGEELPGPFEAAIRQGIDAARAAAGAIEEAVPREVSSRLAVDVVSDVKQAVQGIESRSAEGVREYFRLMRGEGGSVDEQQLEALQGIRAAVEAANNDDDVQIAVAGLL